MYMMSEEKIHGGGREDAQVFSADQPGDLVYFLTSNEISHVAQHQVQSLFGTSQSLVLYRNMHIDDMSTA